jgi:predicted AAA+ superfamily ATPase
VEFHYFYQSKYKNIFIKMIFTRQLKNNIIKDLVNTRKIVLIFGARQTGKTTLCNEILNQLDEDSLRINADQLKYSDVLSSRDLNKLKLLFDGYKFALIDEAQRIPNIRINLKIIYDNMPELKLLVTGSSSFELANSIKEPLTGRTITHKLFPISLSELKDNNSIFEISNNIEEYLTFGLYPEVFQHNNAHSKEKYLRELVSSYLYKDILELSSIKNSNKIANLLKLLAFQIGSEVSINELGQKLALKQETVNSYIDLLEKSFIVFRLKGFSRNLRKEITKRNKIYFWDLGVRNMLIDNFSSLTFRNDVGGIWENFIVAERLKYLAYNEIYTSSYFWRTYTGAELDYIEERNGVLTAFEIKYKKAKQKPPKTWIENYGDNFHCITKADHLPKTREIISAYQSGQWI